MPTVEAMAAVPMLMITDVRIPATITGAASGNSTRHRICQALIPTPRAISRVAGGTDSMPASVPCRIGSRPYNTSAMIAGCSLKPITGTATASTATGGKVCPTATTVSTSERNSRPLRRVTATPAATPRATAIRLEIATSDRCAPTSAIKLSC